MIFSETVLPNSPCIILEKLTIEEFLAKLGMEHYKENFDKHDITMEVLMEMAREGKMDREALKEIGLIGIMSFGHQHEFLEAVKQLV